MKILQITYNFILKEKENFNRIRKYKYLRQIKAGSKIKTALRILRIKIQ